MPGHVLIAGASGVIGRAAVERFAAAGWRVTALSRRDPALACAYDHRAVDLTDAAACAAAVAALDAPTHLVYAAVFEEADLVTGWRSERQMATNLAMLRNLLEPLAATGTLRHVSQFQGTKAYGVHIRPFPVPARESWPRHDHANFYWLQEDFARDLGARTGFDLTVWRPQVVFGDAVGAVMNILPVIGAFAVLEAAEGRPLAFPGGPDYVLEAVDARLVAGALLWAADAEGARGETFNITNGDVFVWRNVWPAIAEALGAATGPDAPRSLADTLPPRSEEWRALATRLGLAEPDLGALMGRSHHYADFVFATGAKRPPAPVIVSTIKLRQAGFHACTDTETMFRELVAALQARRILPSREELAHLGRDR
ncbi:NAD-dependent epimerase/dehydratase family protein [Acuticoccus sp. I52.16.1]|uniref:NAD-dependent epimerase/dehydratase family protein n=1 Tax=Acuticoccus sp. I52.16.1 TaxID=2928472 RepID=UPI001FD3A31F|nr:NAD-dependent epimerase/dehydratase family protein [Acuticoccus sp. I52.16.1]UOM32630.1 NAD-dependent epimerase/dehydratase family protein [Acuticoccus sp. I52.16.1]